MATKAATETTDKVALSPAQRRQLGRLISILSRANENAETAQQTANDFLGYCAEEAGVPVGMDGWQFDQAQMSFVRVEQGGSNGDN